MPTLKQLLHEARWYPRWRLLLVVLAAISAYFAFASGGPPMAVALNDKVGHLMAFSAMGVAAALAWPATRRHAVSAWAGLVGYGAFIEIVQSMLPMRHAGMADLVADALGALAGLLLAAAMRTCVQGATASG